MYTTTHICFYTLLFSPNSVSSQWCTRVSPHYLIRQSLVSHMVLLKSKLSSSVTLATFQVLSGYCTNTGHFCHRTSFYGKMLVSTPANDCWAEQRIKSSPQGSHALLLGLWRVGVLFFLPRRWDANRSYSESHSVPKRNWLGEPENIYLYVW